MNSRIIIHSVNPAHCAIIGQILMHLGTSFTAEKVDAEGIPLNLPSFEFDPNSDRIQPTAGGSNDRS